MMKVHTSSRSRAQAMVAHRASRASAPSRCIRVVVMAGGQRPKLSASSAAQCWQGSPGVTRGEGPGLSFRLPKARYIGSTR